MGWGGLWLAYLQVPFSTLLLWILSLNQTALLIKMASCPSYLSLSRDFSSLPTHSGLFKQAKHSLPPEARGPWLTWYDKACLPQPLLVHSLPECNPDPECCVIFCLRHPIPVLWVHWWANCCWFHLPGAGCHVFGHPINLERKCFFTNKVMQNNR